MWQGLDSLEKHFLSYNLVTTIRADMWTGLSSLKDLSLDNNNITQLSDDVFAPLKNLEGLSIQFRGGARISRWGDTPTQFTTSLNKITSGTFRCLGSLKRLLLTGNNMKTILLEHSLNYQN